MKVQQSFLELKIKSKSVRVCITSPLSEERFPGLILFTDIFQLTPSMLRACARLASYGFTIMAPEIFYRNLELGTALLFDDNGREIGLKAASNISTEEFDADIASYISFLTEHPRVRGRQLGALGFCIGGHLAFRASMFPSIRASACFYATGLESGKLGKGNADTLQKVSSISGELILVFGKQDPHISEDARRQISSALNDARISHTVFEYPGEHAFMRDEGPRYDAESSDAAWSESIRFFRKKLL